MEDINQIQAYYSTIVNQISDLKKVQNDLKNNANSLGYRLKGSNFVLNEQVYGLFYDMTYYSHFDGHRSGAVNEYYEGAAYSRIDAFNYLKNIIENNDFGDEEFWQHLGNVPESCINYIDNDYSDKDKENFRKHLKLVSDTEITWEYSGNNDQGELRDGSYFTIKLCTETEITKVKTKEYTEID